MPQTIVIALAIVAPLAILALLPRALRSQGLERRIWMRLLMRWLVFPLLALLAVPCLIYGERFDRWWHYDPATRERFEALVKTNAHQTVLADAVEFIQQTRTNLLLVRAADLLVLPPSVQQLHPNFVRVKEQELDLVYMDSRGKYGFCILRAGRDWQLAWCEMGDSSRASDWFLHPLATQPGAR